MNTPFTKQPVVDKQTRQAYTLVVYTDESIQNRYLMMQNSTLKCSCSNDQSENECRHTKEKHSEFLRWKRAALQRLRMELTDGQPIPVISKIVSTRIGFPLEMAQVVIGSSGTIFVQYDHGLRERYSETCGWGTMGAKVYPAKDPDEASLLYLLAQELGLPVWSHSMIEEILGPGPRMPPSFFKDTQQQAEMTHLKSGLYNGQGGVVLLIDEKAEYSTRNTSSEGQWASYWTRLCGLDLNDGNWSNVDRYLPGGHLDGKPVGGLAIDLVNCRVKGIPTDMLKNVSASVPSPYRNQVGHVQLPWGTEAETFPGGMVIVKDSEENGMDRDKDLVVLTTNFWQDLHLPESACVRDLISMTAAYLIRMGHNPTTNLQSGNWTHPIGGLAKDAETRLVSSKFLRWNISDQGVSVLKEDIIPSLLKHEFHSTQATSDEVFGEDWPLFLPPC